MNFFEQCSKRNNAAMTTSSQRFANFLSFFCGSFFRRLLFVLSSIITALNNEGIKIMLLAIILH
jgi:hypothetical protein